MDSKKRRLIILSSIFLIAILLRLFYSFVIYPRIADRYNWYLDDGFDELAWNFIQGNGYVFQPGQTPAVQRPPGYPFFLMAIYFIFGKEVWIVQIIQSLLGGLTSLLLYFLGKRIFNERVGIIAAFFFAIYLHSFLYTARLFTEPLYILLMIVFMLYFLKLFERLDLKTSFIVGILLAILTLIKANSLLLPLFLFPPLLLTFWHQKGKVVKNFSILLIAMVLLIGPWTFRNYMVTKHFIPVATLGGQVFYVGNMAIKNDQGKWMTAANDEVQFHLNLESLRIAKEFGINNEAERDKFLYKITLNWIYEHPWLFVKGLVAKFFYFWYLAPSSKMGTIVSLLIHLSFLILSGIGFVLAIRKGVNILIFVLVILYFNLLYALFWAQARYSVPVMPFIMIFAAYTVMNIRHLRKLVNRILHEEEEYVA